MYVALDAHKGQMDLDGKPAIHTKINDLKHNLDRGRKSNKKAKELNDIEKSERLAKINEKHQKALDIFGYMPLYDDGRSRDGQPVPMFSRSFSSKEGVR